MKDNLSLAQKVIILVCTPLLFQIIFVGTLGALLSQAEHDRREETHAKEVATEATLILQLIVEAGATIAIEEQARNFIKTDRLVKRGQSAGERAQRKFEGLKKLVIGHPEEQDAINKIGQVQADILGCLTRARQANRDGDAPAEVVEYVKLNNLVSDFTGTINEVTEKQREIQSSKAGAQARSRYLITAVLLVGVVFNIFLALTIAFYFHRGITYRLSILMDNTRKLVAGEPLNPPVAGTDEIAHLDKVFQEMVSDLQEAQRKERSIIQNAKDVICSIDSRGIFTKVNPACRTVWGYEPEELIGTNFKDLIVASDRDRTSQSIQRISKGESDLPIENRVTCKDGREVDILWSVHWSEAEDSWFCVAHDITERKDVERIKQEFVAMVSHDLRTPLTSIQMYLSLLSTGVYGALNESGKENLSTAGNNINRLINLINDLLDAEKMEAGKLQLHYARMSMGDVLEDALMAVTGYASQQGVELDLIPYDADIVADADRLVQVLVNLLANAVKFSPAGSKVVISAVDHPQCLEVRVCDRGRGIPASHLNSVFDRFAQVKSTDAHKARGAGLGLTICRSIVETHGGTIGVISEEGKGSTFWFRIPRGPDGAIVEQNVSGSKTEPLGVSS